MSVVLDYKNEIEIETLSQAYTEAMDEIMAEDKDVISLDADLMRAVGIEEIKEKYSGRVMDVGVAEANMIGIAAGLSYAGKKPYVQTFACFATRRAFDQIFISAAYGGNPIRIFGSDPGLFAAFNGGTHMPFEDIALMRTIPGAVVIDITDNTMMKDIIRQAKDAKGVFYFRAGRSNTKKVYADGSTFKIGKGNVLKDGTDVTIVAGGFLVSEALNAAQELEEQGISAAVIDMFTIKPIDGDLIEQYAKKTGSIVVCDNHNTNGGLGDAVAAVLVERSPVPMRKLAVFDAFGEVGSREYLEKRFDLNKAGIVRKVQDVLLMKQQRGPL